MNDIYNGHETSVKGLTFEEMTVAMGHGFPNVPSLSDAYREVETLKGAYLLISTHSLGERDWEGKAERFIPEYVGDEEGWHLLVEGGPTMIRCRSATSGSELLATLQKGGTWEVRLRVPFIDEAEAPYEGVYWRTFRSAID